MSLEICKNGFVNLLFRHFVLEDYYDEEQLLEDVQSGGFTLDSWMTVHDPIWTGLYPFYYAYLVWKSTTGQYGYVVFHYLPKKSEGRKHSVFSFDGPYSRDELIERFTHYDKDGHTGLVNSLAILESGVSNKVNSTPLAE